MPLSALYFTNHGICKAWVILTYGLEDMLQSAVVCAAAARAVCLGPLSFDVCHA